MKTARSVILEGMAGPPRVRVDVGCRATAIDRSTGGTVTLVAIGDLMLAGEWEMAAARGRLATGLADLGALGAGADLVFANLETACPGNEGRIAKEPRVVTTPAVIGESLHALGVEVVNLANNHAFDCYWSGFETVRETLEEQGVLSLGAGRDAAEAAAPLTLERGRIRFGLLAYADLGTRPSHVAGAEGFGVNPLASARAVAEVATLRRKVDRVIVSLHWGVEYCHIPSPDQISTARSLVDAGASLVVGHHAHVIQGVETWGEGAIVYNLGNATTTDHFVGGRLAIRQTATTRSSLVVRATFSKARLESVGLVPIRSEQGVVLVDDPYARAILQRANERLARGVTPGRWRRTRLYEDVLVRTVRKLDPRVMASLRPRHIVTLGRNLLSAIQGRQPV